MVCEPLRHPSWACLYSLYELEQGTTVQSDGVYFCCVFRLRTNESDLILNLCLFHPRSVPRNRAHINIMKQVYIFSSNIF